MVSSTRKVKQKMQKLGRKRRPVRKQKLKRKRRRKKRKRRRSKLPFCDTPPEQMISLSCQT